MPTKVITAVKLCGVLSGDIAQNLVKAFIGEKATGGVYAVMSFGYEVDIADVGTSNKVILKYLGDEERIIRSFAAVNVLLQTMVRENGIVHDLELVDNSIGFGTEAIDGFVAVFPELAIGYVSHAEEKGDAQQERNNEQHGITLELMAVFIILPSDF